MTQPHITTCPACSEHAPLVAAELEPLLPSHRCSKCAGQWIRGEHYYRWLEHPDRRPSDANPQTVAADSQHASAPAHRRAMLCPECGRLLSRYQVGHGLNMFIDRCAGCGGIWLDADEWQALKSSHLADRIHFIFSSAWQAQIVRDQQRLAAEQLLAKRIGKADFDRLQELTQWIESHPHGREISAFLLEHLRSTSPPPRGPGAKGGQ